MIRLDNWCRFLHGKGKVSPVPRLDLIIGAGFLIMKGRLPGWIFGTGIHLGMGRIFQVPG